MLRPLMTGIVAAVLGLGLIVEVPVKSAAAPVQAARLVEPAGGFSYVPPAGWHIKTLPGLKYKLCDDAPANNAPAASYTPNMMTTDASHPVSLDTYVHVNLTEMQRLHPDLRVLNFAPFVTGSGLRGRRLTVVVTRSMHRLCQVFYVFPAPGSRIITVLASWLAADGSKYIPAVDGAMKTFKLQ